MGEGFECKLRTYSLEKADLYMGKSLENSRTNITEKAEKPEDYACDDMLSYARYWAPLELVPEY